MRHLVSIVVGSLVGFSAGVTGKHHDVNVGKGGELVFDPEEIKANEGDTVTYHFFAANHTATQASFDKPCEPLDGGFFSAFTPNEEEDEASPTTFTITVSDTKPIWVYCSQAEHCQDGMTSVINEPKDGENTLDAFREKAKDAKENLAPEDGLPVGGERVTQVEVGVDGEFVFEPSEILEPPGTIVRFSFNPANHSVTQSSFDEPCVPLEDGFSSGFVPTEETPSGVLFDIVVKDDKPIWFYCAQGSHCSQKMAGSVNAPQEGDNTHEAFLELASEAGDGQDNPNSPVGGKLTGSAQDNGDGDENEDAGGDEGAVDVPYMDPDMIDEIPKPGEHDQQWLDMAGGGVIPDYDWADDISDKAVAYLHLLHFLDNILLRVLFQAQTHLQQGGDWHGAYPDTVIRSITAMGAQAWIHRATATDSLQHYDKPLLSEECTYKIEEADGGDGIDGFLSHIVTLLSLEIGLLIETTAQLAHSDPWLVPCLVTSLGAKSRMAGYANMMQGHAAAAAPREVAIPGDLVYAHAMTHFVESCPGSDEDEDEDEDKDDDSGDGDGDGEGEGEGEGEGSAGKGSMSQWGKGNRTVEHQLRIAQEHRDDGPEGRLTSIEMHYPNPREGWVAWIGPWGKLYFTELGDGKADVPEQLYGHAWVVLTESKDVGVGELAEYAVAGPEMVWVTAP